METIWKSLGGKKRCIKVIARSRFCSIAVLYLNYEAFLQIGFIGKVLSHFHYCIDSIQGYRYNVWGGQIVLVVSLIYISYWWNYQIMHAHLLTCLSSDIWQFHPSSSIWWGTGHSRSLHHKGKQFNRFNSILSLKVVVLQILQQQLPK